MTLVKRKLTRGDCLKEPRPCQRHCPYRLEGAESCALDVADRGGVTRDDIGELMGLSRERVRQIEEEAVAKVAKRLGRPVPAPEAYAIELDARVDRSDRDAFDEEVLAAIASAERATMAQLSSAFGRGIYAMTNAVERLVDDGRVVRITLPVQRRAYAYEIAAGEAAE